MTKLSKTSIRAMLLVALLSAALVVISFPPWGIWWVAWIGWLPLLTVVQGIASHRIRFFLGFFAGLTIFVATTFWLAPTIHRMGAISWLAAFGAYGLLAAYEALRPAILCLWLAPQNRFNSPLISSTLATVLEGSRAVFIAPFPWLLMGTSQEPGWIANVVISTYGVLGMSWLLWYFAMILAAPLASSGQRNGWLFAVIILPLFFGFAAFEKAITDRRSDDDASQWTVALLQPNFDPVERNRQRAEIETWLLESSRAAIEAGARLMVWPESAIFAPIIDRRGPLLVARLRALADRYDVFFYAGADRIERDASGTDFFNSSIWIGPHREPQIYDKIQLVPFTEYIPYKNSIFFFIERLVPQIGDFSPGVRFAPFAMENHRIAPSICYEAIFSHHFGGLAEQGADILINITNDAWFGSDGVAQKQHFHQARLRALENRRPLLRSANSGITAIIDQSGNIVERMPRNQRGMLIHTIDIAARPPAISALLTKPWLWIICAMIMGLLELITTARKRLKERKTQ